MYRKQKERMVRMYKILKNVVKKTEKFINISIKNHDFISEIDRQNHGESKSSKKII